MLFLGVLCVKKRRVGGIAYLRWRSLIPNLYTQLDTKSREQTYAPSDDLAVEDELDLLYDSCLNCYYDPKTQKYYELIWSLLLELLLRSTNSGVMSEICFVQAHLSILICRSIFHCGIRLHPYVPVFIWAISARVHFQYIWRENVCQ